MPIPKIGNKYAQIPDRCWEGRGGRILEPALFFHPRVPFLLLFSPLSVSRHVQVLFPLPPLPLNERTFLSLIVFISPGPGKVLRPRPKFDVCVRPRPDDQHSEYFRPSRSFINSCGEKKSKNVHGSPRFTIFLVIEHYPRGCYSTWGQLKADGIDPARPPSCPVVGNLRNTRPRRRRVRRPLTLFRSRWEAYDSCDRDVTRYKKGNINFCSLRASDFVSD